MAFGASEGRRWAVVLVCRNRTCGSADLSKRREGRWREDLVADACDGGSIALAVVAHLVPSRIVLECRPPRLAICKRLPREYVGQLIIEFPDERRPMPCLSQMGRGLSLKRASSLGICPGTG